MPRFCLETNVPMQHISSDFLSQCVHALSKLTGKPESFCVAFVETKEMLSDEICGIGSISSIGGLGVHQNEIYSNTFYKLIYDYLGIPKHRCWLTFTENLPEFVTFKGKSFYHITMCRAPGTPIIHSPDE